MPDRPHPNKPNLHSRLLRFGATDRCSPCSRVERCTSATYVHLLKLTAVGYNRTCRGGHSRGSGPQWTGSRNVLATPLEMTQYLQERCRSISRSKIRGRSADQPPGKCPRPCSNVITVTYCRRGCLQEGCTELWRVLCRITTTVCG
jgi:hypothetical protein